MKFLIVTPSHNQLSYLKLCVASVRDQVLEVAEHVDSRSDPEKLKLPMKDRSIAALRENIIVHHHVQDACSTDGTPDWLSQYESEVRAIAEGRSAREACTSLPDSVGAGYSFSYAAEPDDGMYDAVNKGWRAAPEDTDVVAYLNCDEQYLSEALREVFRFLIQHPNIDVVFSDVVVVHPDGSYICSRRTVMPSKYHILTSHLPTFTAATFIRMKAVREHKLYFDCRWKCAGDAEWALRRIDAGIHAGVMRHYTASFADSGENLDVRMGGDDKRRLFQRASSSVRRLKWLWILHHRFRKLMAGGYAHTAFSYSIYLSDDIACRKTFHVQRSDGVWRKRL